MGSRKPVQKKKNKNIHNATDGVFWHNDTVEARQDFTPKKIYILSKNVVDYRTVLRVTLNILHPWINKRRCVVIADRYLASARACDGTEEAWIEGSSVAA